MTVARLDIDRLITLLADVAMQATGVQEQLQKANAERAKVHDLVQEVFVGLCHDNENGVAWMNDEAAAEWVRKYPCTHNALQALAKFVEDWDDETTGEPS